MSTSRRPALPFFALITERKIRRGIYRSVAALRADISSFLAQHNADPKPFRSTKSPDDILTSIERFCLTNSRPTNKQANFCTRTSPQPDLRSDHCVMVDLTEGR